MRCPHHRACGINIITCVVDEHIQLAVKRLDGIFDGALPLVWLQVRYCQSTGLPHLHAANALGCHELF